MQRRSFLKATGAGAGLAVLPAVDIAGTKPLARGGIIPNADLTRLYGEAELIMPLSRTAKGLGVDAVAAKEAMDKLRRS